MVLHISHLELRTTGVIVEHVFWEALVTFSLHNMGCFSLRDPGVFCLRTFTVHHLEGKAADAN